MQVIQLTNNVIINYENTEGVAHKVRTHFFGLFGPPLLPHTQITSLIVQGCYYYRTLLANPPSPPQSIPTLWTTPKKV